MVLDLGIELFSSGLGDLYYPSNELDPYLKDAAVRLYSLFLLKLSYFKVFFWNIKVWCFKDDDDDDEEDIDDTTIKPTDSVIICARNEDEVSHLEVYGQSFSLM